MSLRLYLSVGRPLTSTSPAAGWWMPSIRSTSVDLPLPLGPTMPTKSPASSAKLMRRSTGRVVVGEVHVLERDERSGGSLGRSHHTRLPRRSR